MAIALVSSATMDRARRPCFACSPASIRRRADPRRSKARFHRSPISRSAWIPEATGWENIIFRCAFMGLSFREAKRLSPAIAEFSELGEYLDLPTRTYSTGMFLRLAFAISTSIEPEILIMDEMISAGDAQFIEKAQRRLHELVDKANILALASHDMKIIQKSATKWSGWSMAIVKAFGAAGDRRGGLSERLSEGRATKRMTRLVILGAHGQVGGALAARVRQAGIAL